MNDSFEYKLSENSKIWFQPHEAPVRAAGVGGGRHGVDDNLGHSLVCGAVGKRKQTSEPRSYFKVKTSISQSIDRSSSSFIL